ncbi:hypothetical protein PF006_g26573 [Phytophthora fragariae]|uniref:Uncharacterized protein n=1 Tax=Phytophthora fragariae TaxID=53985 RepID=A0A6A3QWH5_9STRA|nr:hypothetical protein PF006_g26573 [Phytophthora fragariae]
MLAMMALATGVSGHGYMTEPAVTFLSSSTDNTQFIATIESSASGFSGTFSGSPADNTAAFTTAFDSSSYTSLKDLINSLATVTVTDATLTCGSCDPDETAQPLPNEYVERSHSSTEGFTASHEGPCEVWCDDVRVFHDDACAADYTSAPAELPYDRDACLGTSTLTFYWLALHSLTWQVYVNCAPLETTTSTGATSKYAVSGASSGTSTSISTNSTSTTSTVSSAASSTASGSYNFNTNFATSTSASTGDDATSDTDAPAVTTSTPTTEAPTATPTATTATPSTATSTETILTTNDPTQFIATIEASASGFSGTFNAAPADNTAAFTKAFESSSYSSLKDLINDKATITVSDATLTCGACDPDESAQPLPDTYVEWAHSDSEGFTASHEGPCEVWCDDVRVFHDDDCAADYTSAPAKLQYETTSNESVFLDKTKWWRSVFLFDVVSYDHDACLGSSTLTFYWLALHSSTWQVYVNCAPLETTASTGATSKYAVGASSGTSTTATSTVSSAAGSSASSNSTAYNFQTDYATSTAASTSTDAPATTTVTTTAPVATTATPSTAATRLRTSGRRNYTKIQSTHQDEVSDDT